MVFKYNMERRCKLNIEDKVSECSMASITLVCLDDGVGGRCMADYVRLHR